jgi:hypothetical protein
MKVSTWLLKTLNWAEWISAVIGLALVLLGVISALTHVSILHVRFMSSYFEGANSFFLIAIVLFLFIHFGQFKKE